MTQFDCPRCGVNLTMSERAGIEIDYCPSCRGVWLDRGELDKIIERAAANEPPPPPPQPVPQQQPAWTQAPPQGWVPPPQVAGHGYGHGSGHGYGKRRKSWLSDLFD